MTKDPKIAIIIPARYNSSRFPGKPLAKINGVTMLQRVVTLARYAAREFPEVEIYVATENLQIQKHAEEIGANCMLTDPQHPTGSDRVLGAIEQLDEKPDYVINLQGDAPFIEPVAVKRIIQAFLDNPEHEVVTPINRLVWRDVDRLRENKKTTPFSGTTVIIDENGQAVWFSKNIIPAVRRETNMREADEYSPIFQHVGLYGYRMDVLQKFCKLKPSHYEKLEGLEQLRLLENGFKIQTVEIELMPGRSSSGIDSAEDVERAEARISQFGDLMDNQKLL